MESLIRLSLGPFQGITDMVFRNIYHEQFQGIDKYYTPFFTGIQKDHAKNLQTEEIDVLHNDTNILTPQILSNDAEEIIRFAKQCQELGYHEINLNMGCPFARVANKKRGSGLLPYPDLIADLLAKVFDEITIKFSLKCRFGYYYPDELELLLPIFNQYPLSELIIHPRIGKQLYSGIADYQAFAKIAPFIKAPLVYNGDIFTVKDLRMRQEIIPTVKEFMLGRGLLANPFLPEMIKGIDSGNKTERLYHFVDDLYHERLRHTGGSPKVLGRMKELWTYIMNDFEEPQHVWRAIKKLNSTSEYEDAVDIIFKENKVIL